MSLLREEYRIQRDCLRYGFAVGKVRVLETRLLGRTTLERLVDAVDFAEQKRILSETPYGRFLDSATTPASVEEAVENALESAYGFLDEAGLPSAVIDFFRLRFDFANLKAAAKARALRMSTEGLIVAHGSVGAEAFDGPLDRLPEPLGAVAVAIERMQAENPLALMALEALVDRAMFAALGEAADRAGGTFLHLVVRLLIDLANLKTLVRGRAAGVPVDRFKDDLFIVGGNVEVRELVRMVRLPVAEMGTALERRFRLTGQPFTGGDETLDLDVVVDNALVAAVRRGRRPEPGAEDVIAYVLAREAEAQVLRVVLLGKMAGLDSAALHRRMRASFR
jgi:V/A-type H+-transporting ATPase subunit C